MSAPVSAPVSAPRRLARAARLVLGGIALAALPAAAAAQPTVAADFRAEVLDLPPGPDGGRYRLNVLLPPEHATAREPLPVLYYLDAWWWGDLLDGIVRVAALARPPRIAPVILVGIATLGDEAAWHRARNRDFTPSHHRPPAPGVQVRAGNVVLDSAGTGGAAAFLAYLEREVVPLVERRYRAGDDRGIAGHSFGGLLAAFALATRPALFDRYLLVSPATYWNEAEVLGLGVFAGEVPAPRARVFVAAGDREWPVMTRSADALARALDALEGVEVERARYPGADHLTVLPAALLDGIIHLYGR